jgi:hypothetical protein
MKLLKVKYLPNRSEPNRTELNMSSSRRTAFELFDYFFGKSSKLTEYDAFKC